MNKYDYGYDLQSGSTAEWAYHLIAPNSLVLEVGPSNGNLISHLTKNKGCTADIVEISTESGKEAAQFARHACLGEIEGNLERDEWVQMLSPNKYDYIVILDVLEHVHDPEKVLTKLKLLLKDEGTILLSVPNIGHNSILINLLANKFVYTSVGLLDDTHVHFYTYESLKQLLEKVGLVTKSEEVNQKQVGENEVTAYYGNLPSGVESFLKTRPLGTAYQFLFQIQKGNKQPPVELQYVEDACYSVFAFLEDKVVYSQNVNPLRTICGSFRLETPAAQLRLDPLDKNCVLKDWEIQGYDRDGNLQNIASFQFTGNDLNGKMVFYDDDPQMFITWDNPVSSVQFRYALDVFDNDALRIIMKQRDHTRALERFQEDAITLRTHLEQEKNQLASYCADLEIQIKDLGEKSSLLQTEIEKQNILVHELQKEIEASRERELQWQANLQAEQNNAAQLLNCLAEEQNKSQNLRQQLDNLRQQLSAHKIKSIWKILKGDIW